MEDHSLESPFGLDTSTRPSLTKEEKTTIDEILIYPETVISPEQKATFVLNNINNTEKPLNNKQKVYALLEVDEETFQEIERQTKEMSGAAKAGMEMGLYVQDLNNEEYIKTKSALHGTPLYLIAALVRRKLNRAGGYPSEWDDELQELPGFETGDDLSRYTQGERMSYEEAVNRKKEEVAFKFVKQIHDQSARTEDRINITPQNVFQRYIDYAVQLPQKKGFDITLEDIARGAKNFASRYRGNQQIEDSSNNIKMVIDIILEHKDENGNINLERLPKSPEFRYPKFDSKRGYRY